MARLELQNAKGHWCSTMIKQKRKLAETESTSVEQIRRRGHKELKKNKK